MAIELSWWEGGEVLEYQCEGRVDGAELVAANREAIADPRFRELKVQLCDMEAVGSFDIGEPDIKTIIEIDMQASALAPAMTRVAIACREDLIFGYARMYEMLLEGRVPGWEVGVFRTREQARAWLGV